MPYLIRTQLNAVLSVPKPSRDDYNFTLIFSRDSAPESEGEYTLTLPSSHICPPTLTIEDLHALKDLIIEAINRHPRTPKSKA